MTEVCWQGNILLQDSCMQPVQVTLVNGNPQHPQNSRIRVCRYTGRNEKRRRCRTALIAQMFRFSGRANARSHSST